MSSRSTRPYAPYRVAPSYAHRPQPAAEGVDGMRVGGFVVLALGVWKLAERWVLSFWLDTDTSLSVTLGGTAFYVALGLAMLQGSNAARRVVLVLTGLVLIGIGLALTGMYIVGFGHLWPRFVADGLSTLGIFVLLLSTEPSLGRVIGSVACIVVGWAGSVVSSILLVGTLDLSTMNMIRQWQRSDRTVSDAEAGFELRVPARWVAFKEGNPLDEEGETLVTLANTEILAFAKVFKRNRTHASLDYFLDSFAKDFETRGDIEDFQYGERSDGRVSETATRRLTTTLSRDGTRLSTLYTGWQDGDIYFLIVLIGPRAISQRLAEERARLEAAIAFSAPVRTFLEKEAPSILGACPLLSEKALLRVTHVVPLKSPAELYCREGYRLALKGQPLIDPASAEHLRSLMQALFAAMPRARIDRFGKYVERLVANQPTSPVEDREMMEAVRSAAATLPQTTQDNLRLYVATALEMGQFEPGQGGH